MPLPSPARLAARVAPRGLPGARRLLGAGLNRVFGPPPFDASRHAGDPGLFGPGSASWRVIGEPAAIVGGVRALLVQLLHPLAMAGVADHSGYRTDAIGRLQRTSAYVVTTTFGAIDEVLQIAAAVRRTHEPVVGTAPDGRPYSADDPHLLAWIQIALTSSFLATDRFYAADPVGSPVADAFVAEQSYGAALLDRRVDLAAIAADRDARAELRAGALTRPMVEDGLLPRSVDELDALLAAYAPELEVNEQGRDGLRFLLWPQLGPAVRAAYLPMLGGAVASLEPEQRRLLGLPASPAPFWPLRTNAAALLGAFRVVAGRSPSARAATRRVRGDGEPRSGTDRGRATA
jgi:uncharacterized protein (DUF2236 family)